MQKYSTIKYLCKTFKAGLVVVLTVLFSLSFTASVFAGSKDFLNIADNFLTQTQLSQSPIQKDLIDIKRSRTRIEKQEIRVSLDQAVRRVRSSSGGKVIKASTSWSNGRPIHNIRVLSKDNRVRTYRVDGVTGRSL